MKTLFRSIVIGLIVVVCTACAGVPVEMGSHSGSSVGGTARTITAQACGFQLLLLIPIALNSRAERAYQALVAQASGDVLTDIQVKEKWTYAFVGTSYCTVMRAKAIHFSGT